MIKKGDILTLTIEDYAFEGKGISKVNLEENLTDKFVIFVNKAYPNDKVKVQIIKKKKNYAEAIVLDILEESSERVIPICKYFGTCGGCKQQDLNYDKQKEYKYEQVKDIFRIHLENSNFPIEPIIASDNQFHYRNKTEFTFSNRRWLTKEDLNSKEVQDADFSLGMHLPRIFDKILDVNECYLHSKESDLIINATRDFFKKRKIQPYSTKDHAGYLRNLVLRKSFRLNDFMVNLVTSSENNLLMKEYTEYLLSQFNFVSTIVNNINLRKAAIAKGDYEKIYYGSGIIYDLIGDYKFRISSNSFFQTNTIQAENLYKTALNFAEFDGSETVYDLYSGAGTISIFVSKYVKYVYGFEYVQDAVDDAIENINLNNINNCRFFSVNLDKRILDFLNINNIPKPDVIIADPPRSGMNPNTVKDIIALSPKKIVYVSCNPSTQERDISKLVEEGGYKIIKLKPVDMFPQTYHIENVALLRKI